MLFFLKLKWNEAKAGSSAIVPAARASHIEVVCVENESPMKNALFAGVMLVLTASLLGATNSAAAPQGGSGVVTGVVLGADNKPVPNAVITYQNAGGSAPHMAHADAHGHFTISKLKGDVYAIRATNNGVSSTWENVAVRPGKTRTIALHTIHVKEEPKQYTATHAYEQQPE